MTWYYAETLPWQSPLALARAHAPSDMALLYSGLSERFTGQHSYLFLDPLETIEGSDWSTLPPLPPNNDSLPIWVGYLGYGMRDTPERGNPSPITLPDFRLTRYATLYHFNHATQTVKLYHSSLRGLQAEAIQPKKNNTELLRSTRNDVSAIQSNLTRTEYERIVTKTIDQIRDGQFYQANITRKFFGAFGSTPDSLAIFTKLCEASPAPYAAYIKHGETMILSSSPECFLTIGANGTITTRPIKGSARRSVNESEDKKIRESLATSSKNHAENLMIVDLMRNDLSRVAEPQSVEVLEQSALYSYSTIHHLISTIRAQKRVGVNAFDAVRASFPAGSMTGAPKLAAMQWCTEQEQLERGVYSGAIGWFGAGDTCDLSVVIRTLIIENNRFEFQVGGGIVSDSTPEDEWRETIAKARGILAALEIDETIIAAL